jgi:signal transduction histidine kinase
MKWGLRSQLILPVSTMSFVTIFGLGIWLAWQYARNSQSQTEKRMVQLASTIRESSFPINQSIIEQLKGLSGADFLVCKLEGEVVLATDPKLGGATESDGIYGNLFDQSATNPSAISPSPADNTQDLQVRSIRLSNGDYLWMQVPRRAIPRGEIRIIHVLFPMEEIVRQRWQAIPAILAACLIAWILSVIVTAIIVGRLAKPLKDLHRQVKRIAAGEFVKIPIPHQPLEIKELVDGVNEMSTQLELTQHSIRESERLKTLSVLGGGIAHQLRNSATGALLALDFAEQYQSAEGKESMGVAKRQLQLMEKYVQKFLNLRRNETNQFRWVSIHDQLSEIETLVRPFARHHEVELNFDAATTLPSAIWAEPDSLQDMLLNLLLNAIQAAASSSAQSSAKQPANVSATGENSISIFRAPGVWLKLTIEDEWIVIDVRDNGPGLSPDIEQHLFEPFATNRMNGIGLGLYVARQATISHHGEIRYVREHDATCFSVKLPLLRP